MPIIKEYRCNDCESFFESMDADPTCPQCSAVEPERAFLTAPGIKDGKTAIADREMRNLSETYGLSDMNNKGGQSVMAGQKPDQAAQFASAADPKIGQVLAKLGSNSDSMSPMLPVLRQMGGPRAWQKVPARK